MSDGKFLKTEGLTFIGAGKIMYNKLPYDFNIPHLHFLVIKHDQSTYEAVNIEFQLFAMSDTAEKSIAELISLTTSYILTVVTKGRGFTEFMEIAMERSMDNYWAAYRRIENESNKELEDSIFKEMQQVYIDKANEFLVGTFTSLIPSSFARYDQL
ncbi:hypothetical protein [Treponema phagedenis]|uniref:Uncharacterized protein n=1 Tax=Treponema phagedenis TaxID=162 RepID=A0AAE6IUI1_TREPH|nr:hypothetical protein [Treponema phagedenis]QEJ98171.1 hypothetical protein FUT82_09275 [Treponema phagedenis]QEK03678.1 hypothetical protein FUT83_07580 [Treponema phagedenis]QEK09295.1 hypothetical protein FUT81_07490 [Treponema phagedenis]